MSAIAACLHRCTVEYTIAHLIIAACDESHGPRVMLPRAAERSILDAQVRPTQRREAAGGRNAGIRIARAGGRRRVVAVRRVDRRCLQVDVRIAWRALWRPVRA